MEDCYEVVGEGYCLLGGYVGWDLHVFSGVDDGGIGDLLCLEGIRVR